MAGPHRLWVQFILQESVCASALPGRQHAVTMQTGNPGPNRQMPALEDRERPGPWRCAEERRLRPPRPKPGGLGSLRAGAPPRTSSPRTLEPQVPRELPGAPDPAGGRRRAAPSAWLLPRGLLPLPGTSIPARGFPCPRIISLSPPVSPCVRGRVSAFVSVSLCVCASPSLCLPLPFSGLFLCLPLRVLLLCVPGAPPRHRSLPFRGAAPLP